MTSEWALAEVEAKRVRGLMTGMSTSAFVTAAVTFVLGGDPLALRIHAGALVATGLVSGVCALRFNSAVAKWVVVSQIGVLLTGFYFWGVFSAYSSLVPLTLYIVAGVSSEREAWIGTAVCVIAQTAFSLATILGWIGSRGLVEPVLSRVWHPIAAQIIVVVLLQTVTLGAMAAGRAARKSSAAVLEAHNRALRELARREGQLAEAYAEARAAREADEGGAGRFSDQVIDGFKLGHVLGRGGMGEVYAARRVADEMPVAIKILAPHLLSEQSARDRFLRESEIVSSLTSPHVVRVLGVSRPDAAMPYIAMERLEGIDLAQLLKRQPALPLDEIVELAIQVADGLDAAHRAGVIHRDLKPSNLHATGTANTRVWKLLDFGASKWRDGESSLTQDRVVGTPNYMAPEQALGRAVDPRTDVYALGVILYRLLTGVPAVVPVEIPAMLHEVAYRVPVQPSKRANVTPELEAVLAIALAKQPSRRFASAGLLARALKAAAAGDVDRGIMERASALLKENPWGAWVSKRAGTDHQS